MYLMDEVITKLPITECDELGHEFGWNDQAGICLNCGLLHDCEAEWSFEEVDLHQRCEVCHFWCDNELSEKIDNNNQEIDEARE